MQTCKYSSTMNEALPFGADYGCAIEKPSKKEKTAEYVMAILIVELSK